MTQSTNPVSGSSKADAILETIRSRRVVRWYTDEPVAADQLRAIVSAGRSASSAGNRRIHRFLILRDPDIIVSLRRFSPGILGFPPSLIVVSTDLDLAAEEHVQLERDYNTWIDVGTVMASMMLAAHALGLGSCPATSFSQSAIHRVLSFPPTLRPELLLQIGYPAKRPAIRRSVGPRRATAEELTDWEVLGRKEP